MSECSWDSIKVLKTNCPILSGRRERVILSQTKQLVMGRWDWWEKVHWHPLLTCYCKYKYTQFAENLSSFSSQFTLRQMYISHSRPSQLIEKYMSWCCALFVTLCLFVAWPREANDVPLLSPISTNDRLATDKYFFESGDENPLESWLWMHQWMTESQSNLT